MASAATTTTVTNSSAVLATRSKRLRDSVAEAAGAALSVLASGEARGVGLEIVIVPAASNNNKRSKTGHSSSSSSSSSGEDDGGASGTISVSIMAKVDKDIDDEGESKQGAVVGARAAAAAAAANRAVSLSSVASAVPKTSTTTSSAGDEKRAVTKGGGDKKVEAKKKKEVKAPVVDSEATESDSDPDSDDDEDGEDGDLSTSEKSFLRKRGFKKGGMLAVRLAICMDKNERKTGTAEEGLMWLDVGCVLTVNNQIGEWTAVKMEHGELTRRLPEYIVPDVTTRTGSCAFHTCAVTSAAFRSDMLSDYALYCYGESTHPSKNSTRLTCVDECKEVLTQLADKVFYICHRLKKHQGNNLVNVWTVRVNDQIYPARIIFYEPDLYT